MTMERSASIMDAIFTSTEDESRARLLKIIQEFLISEAAKHSAKEKGMEIDDRSELGQLVFLQKTPRKRQKRQMLIMLIWTSWSEIPTDLRILGLAIYMIIIEKGTY